MVGLPEELEGLSQNSRLFPEVNLGRTSIGTGNVNPVIPGVMSRPQRLARGRWSRPLRE